MKLIYNWFAYIYRKQRQEILFVLVCIVCICVFTRNLNKVGSLLGLRRVFWLDDSSTIRLVAHFRCEAWCLLKLHIDPTSLFLLVLLANMRGNSFLSQLLWLPHISIYEHHVFHVVHTFRTLLELLMAQRHSLTMGGWGVAHGSTGWCLKRVNLHAVCHRSLHGTCASWGLNAIVHWVQGRFLCHSCIARSPGPPTNALLLLGTKLTAMWLRHIHCPVYRVVLLKF